MNDDLLNNICSKLDEKGYNGGLISKTIDNNTATITLKYGCLYGEESLFKIIEKILPHTVSLKSMNFKEHEYSINLKGF